MALSGNFSKAVGPYNELYATWTASQNTAGNYSDVTLKLYWRATRAGVGPVYASSSNAWSVVINGDQKTGYATPYLQAGGSKLIATHTVRVPHNSDGSKSFNMSAYFDVNATLSGNYYGRQSMSDSDVLNPIPRESSLAVNANFTAGKDKTISISRHASSFNHTVQMYAKNRAGSWVFVNGMSFSTSQTSLSSAFTDGEWELVFDVLDGRASCDFRVVLDTFSGSTFIGSDVEEGTMTAPLASFTETQSSFVVGESFPVAVKWYDSAFRHTVRLRSGSTLLKSYSNVASSVAFDTASIAATLQNLMANVSSLSLIIDVTTYYGSEIVRSATTEGITARITDAAPSFVGDPLYKDTNAAAVAITGSNQAIVSNVSTVQVELPAAMKATAVKGATMKEYIATLAGKSVTRPYAASGSVFFDFGKITAKTNQTLLIRAVDSRGFSTLVSKVIPIIPYDTPGITVAAARKNGFENDTDIKLSGTLSSVLVGGVAKNALLSAQYRIKDAGGAWGSYISFATAGFPSFTATDQVQNLDNTKAFVVEFKVTDNFGSTVLERTVNKGKPLIHFDEMLNAIGIGDFPNAADEVLMSLKMRFGGNRWGANAGLDMGNGDIIGLNGLWMADIADNDGEGILWLKEGATPGSTNRADYQTLRVRNGIGYLDGKVVFVINDGPLWEGAYYMQSGQVVTPSKPMSQCPNGWVLLWSRFQSGALETGWSTTLIPKQFGPMAGELRQFVAGANGALRMKALWLEDYQIAGDSINSTAPNNEVVLRAIYPY